MSTALTDHAAVIDLNGTGHYFTWGILQISYANAAVIALMILAFVLALVLPFPGHAADAGTVAPATAPPPAGPTGDGLADGQVQP